MNASSTVPGVLASVDRILRGRALVLTGFLGVVAIGTTLFVLIWLRALSSSADGVSTSTGARTGLVALLGFLIVGVTFRRLQLRNFRWLPLIPSLITAGFVGLAGFLFATDRLDPAYAFYGGLQVLRSDKLFSDTHWVLSWFDCDQCERWDPNYGPSLALLDPLTGGSIGLSWLAPLGLLLTAMALISIWMLSVVSGPLARWLLILAAASPAWLLLIDRANADLVILGATVIGVWFVARSPSLLSWSLFAAGLWILGTIKYFPFAMGLGLLLALTVRHGWIVIVGFLTASFAYVGLVWDSYQRSSEWNSSGILVLGDFPAYGRIQTVDFAVGLDSVPFAQAFVVTLLTLLVFAGFAMGYGAVDVPDRIGQRVLFGSLALAGSIAFLGKVLWGGFGFMYSGAFLILAVPLLVASGRRISLRNGMNAAASFLFILSVFTAYNTSLATIAGVAFAGYGLGAGIRIAYVSWRDSCTTTETAEV